MVDAPKAVEIAHQSLETLVPAFASLNPRVEEIEQSMNDNTWVITFRADNPEPSGKTSGLSRVYFPYVEKVVLVTMDSGDLLAIRNRSYE